jgi:uncharacterized cupredoxin-like copper-binding protein
MAYLKHGVIPLAAGLVFALSAIGASAATVVNVEFWDKRADLVMAKGLGYATPKLDMSKAPMGMKLSRASAPAGVVTFNVTNGSKDTAHEMVVIHLQDPSKPLPYIDKDNRVDEDKADGKGEVSELDPGKSGSLTVTLEPGKYLLICNVPGHYVSGMWAEFDVTE